MDAQINNSSETLCRIRRVFTDSLELNLSSEDVDLAGRLDEVAGFDSAAAIVFVSALEQEFGITIEPEKLQLEFIRDMNQVAVYIDQRIGK